MSEPIDRDDLLKKINSKLGWIIFFLVLITLNTCSVADDIKDAVRPDRDPPATEESA